MTKEEFRDLLLQALEVATQNAEKQLGRSVPRRVDIEFHGFASHSRMMTPDEAVDVLYLGPGTFYRIVDVAVLRVLADRCIVFMRVSGHKPATFSKTWNQPEGSGPFKQLMANPIKVE
jgi:hypothetical protein